MAGRLWTSLFIFLIFAPGASYLLLESEQKIGGVEKKERIVELSVESFFSGEFQKSFDRRLRRKLPIWLSLYKTENQINLSLFKQVSAGYKSRVILGRDGHLIESAYLDSANKIAKFSAKRIATKVSELRELQDRLETRGISFLLLLSPNKPSFYPELIPERYRVVGAEERENAYDILVPLLDKHQINYLDSRGFLSQQNPPGNSRWFASSGTHWNEFAACLVTKEIVRRVGALLQQALTTFACEPAEERQLPRAPDRDLAELLNVWSDAGVLQPAFRPANVTIKGDSLAPRMLFVGTSFLWAVMRFLDKHRVYSHRDMYYYFKRNVVFPGGKSSPLKVEKLEWEHQVFNNDVVVLEVNEAFPHKVGYGFVKRALAALADRAD